jgi:hypothetical protein
MSYYTYLVGWKHLNKFYYGVRYCKNCSIESLWTTYFTSSKIVKEYRSKYGEPDVVEIRKEFDQKEKAFLWEQKVLRKLGVPHNEKFLNQNIGGNFRGPKNHNFIYNNPMKNIKSREKLSETRKRLGLGIKSIKHLKPLYGDKNPMRNPEIAKRFSEQITGRKRAYKPDGSWVWCYPNK